ncbi:unnamed protein product [Pseudo-nitzschia multistriata]|uniref:HhH-GPD domain-containing protein n=1 Tax=Pseudo-nitzschia multistriata TaxID=183589 RepID=A0A448ZHH7_9STRA|nr:unnamed protein product [Pseudo-nitzschia multistriata]
MSTNQHDYRWLLRRDRSQHRRLGSLWKFLLLASTSSFRSSSCQTRSLCSTNLAQAAFWSSSRRIENNQRKYFLTATSSMNSSSNRNTIVGMVPTNTVATVSRRSVVENPSSPTMSLQIRRSSRIRGMKSDNGTGEQVRRQSVRLFQGKSVDAGTKRKRKRGNNNKDVSLSHDGIIPVVPSEKRVTRSISGGLKSCPTSESTPDAGVDGKRETAKRGRKVKATTVASTPIRGTNAIPVTPEPPISCNIDVSSEKNDSKTKTIAKTKSKAKTKTPTKTAAETKKKSGGKKKKAKTTTKKKKATTGTAIWQAPAGWRETYTLVEELRKDKTAPCDYMGAEALVMPMRDETENGDEDLLKTRRFQTLIALMLSSQTKDAMVGQAMKNLRDTSDGSGGLTVASILAMDPKVLNSKIYSVGFRNNKTKYIKQVAQILQEEYSGDIPSTADEMIKNLPGIGPKMAYIIENICWDRQSGIGVDTHMQRLFPKLGWVSPDTKTPEQTRKQLESWLPREFWGDVNLLWVGFGQEVQQERQKILGKALQSSRPLEALRLLKAVEFDVGKEWDVMLSSSLSATEGEKKELPWTDNNEMEKMNAMIEGALLEGKLTK